MRVSFTSFLINDYIHATLEWKIRIRCLPYRPIQKAIIRIWKVGFEFKRISLIVDTLYIVGHIVFVLLLLFWYNASSLNLKPREPNIKYIFLKRLIALNQGIIVNTDISRTRVRCTFHYTVSKSFKFMTHLIYYIPIKILSQCCQ